MFDPRRVYSNDRRFSHKAQIIQKRPITSEENARRPVAASDLERAKVVMDSFGYFWYTFNPVMRITLRPKATLQPLYVDPYDTLIKDININYWTVDNPNFFKGVYQAVIFLRAYNVYITQTQSLETNLYYLVEAYYCNGESSTLPGYGVFHMRAKQNESSSMTTYTNVYAPYTDTTHTSYRLIQSVKSDEYESAIEAIAIAY